MLGKERCKEIRQKTGLSQKYFAQLMRTKRGTIASYEGGKRSPCASSTLRYIKIAFELGIELTSDELEI